MKATTGTLQAPEPVLENGAGMHGVCAAGGLVAVAMIAVAAGARAARRSTRGRSRARSPAQQARLTLLLIGQSPDDVRVVLGAALALRRFLAEELGVGGQSTTAEEWLGKLKADRRCDAAWADEAVGLLRLCEERVYGSLAGPPAAVVVAAARQLIDRWGGERGS